MSKEARGFHASSLYRRHAARAIDVTSGDLEGLARLAVTLPEVCLDIAILQF